jgi:hypothetical protein
VSRLYRRLVAAVLVLGSALGVGPTPSQAADAVLYGTRPAPGVAQLTLPQPIWLPGNLGGHIWVSDNSLTFCRVDGPPDPTTGALSVNASTCDATAKAPAQAVLDPRQNADGTYFVYVADDSTQSRGVVRITFDPKTETIVPFSGIVLGDGATAARTSSIAYNPSDGKLYVSHDKGGTIFRIVAPNQDIWQQYSEIVGRTTDGRGVRGGMAFVCGTRAGTCDLFIGETGGNGVSVIADASSCDPLGFGAACGATPTSITTNAPGGLTSDGNQLLFVGDAPLSGVDTVLRYNVFTDTQDVISSRVPGYSAAYPMAHTQTGYTGITGLAIDSAGNLYVGDDPTLNAATPPPLQQGKMWMIRGVYQTTVACNAQAVPPVNTACADALGSPGNPAQIMPPPALAKPAALVSFGQTAPAGVTWIPGSLGGHYWVADHTQGLCRLDQSPDHPSLKAANPVTCDKGGVIGSPGQPVYDATGKFVYVPDAAVKSPGLWRLNVDPVTETISNPTLMAPGAGLDNDKLVGVAMGPDNNLYAAGLKNGFVYRIQNVRGDPAAMAVDIIGITSDNRGINGSLGFVGSDLYLPENRGATVIKNATGCAVAANSFAPCTATPLNIPFITFVQSISTDAQHGVVYIAVASGPSNATIYRYTPASGASVVYATQAQLPADLSSGYVEDCTTTCQRKLDPGETANGIIGMHFPIGTFVDPSGNLLVGDDILAGTRGFHGHVWSVPYTP